jgi:hypothetical protein
MFNDIRGSETVSLARVYLDSVRFRGSDKGLDKHFCVFKVHVFVNGAMNEKDAVFTRGEVGFGKFKVLNQKKIGLKECWYITTG